MPSIPFTLPHWAYWLGLILFPLIAMYLARRPRPEPRYGVGLGYLILLAGGFLGLHRFYLRNPWGLAFIPLFLFILFASASQREARVELSAASNGLASAEQTIDRAGPRLEAARADVARYQAMFEEAEPGSFAARGAERRVERARQTIAQVEARVETARADVTRLRPEVEAASADRAFWSAAARYAFYLVLALLAIEAALLPGLVRRANDALDGASETPAEVALEVAEAATGADHDRSLAANPIDRLSLFAGEFVAYWAVIAVFVYYFEVISRYVFNSPTSWAHESMYLMFGMQYLIAGAYATLTETHVRVDVFYAPLSARGKAIADLLTSVFFFIFAGTLLATSYIFAMDSIAVPSGNALVSGWARGEIGLFEMLGGMGAGQWTDPAIRWGEISFNEWEVPLWPMKWVMALGALLLLLQGVSKVAKDVATLARGG